MISARPLIWAAIAASGPLLGACQRDEPRPPRPEQGAPARSAAKPPAPVAEPAPALPAALPRVPDEWSTPAAIRHYLQSNPKSPRAAKLEKLHDDKLLPCPGVRAQSTACNSNDPLVARGLLDRAERYLKHCYECRQKLAVVAVKTRMAAVVRRHVTERARQQFAAALAHRDYTHAAQILADATPGASDYWLKHADRWLEKLRGQPLDVTCRVPEHVEVLISPRMPAAGDRPRVLIVSERPIAGARLASSSGPVRALAEGGGPPWYWAGELEPAKPGSQQISLQSAGKAVACQRFGVAKERPPVTTPEGLPWPSIRGWDRNAENLYSAWLEVLFRDREGKRYHGLGEVTGNRENNLLFNHLGLGEDTGHGIGAKDLQPDCADNPFFLRAYFAWKLGLPFGHHDCRFGSDHGAAQCKHWASNDRPRDPDPPRDAEASDAGLADGDAGAAAGGSTPPGRPSSEEDAGAQPRVPLRARDFAAFLWQLKEQIHARSLRTALHDDATDLYPVVLDRKGLRPGVVFSDPYGHTLTLVRWVEQTAESPGVLLAVDAQPDGTLGIKRFWRGNFLFPTSHPIGGHGFKAFRPIVLDEDGPRLLTNHEISLAFGYERYSAQQARMGAADFYATMDRLINPRPLPPEREYHQLHEALHEQLLSRVREINIAEEFLVEREGRRIEMPEGREVFHTNGPWEALSTPCRDMRLLVGMDVLQSFVEQATSDLPQDAKARVRAELEKRHQRWASELEISYTRSDGSSQSLSLAELLRRQKRFEMGYNPNDCPEVRWGAPEGSAERSTCKRRAPAAQRQQMQQLRHWFEKRYSCG